MMRYLSVCSGIEAASVAWAPLGWTPVGFAEIDAFPSRVLAHRFGSNMPSEPLAGNGVPNFGDFTTIDLGLLGPVDLLVGGTPCQTFSIAGLRRSLTDARGNLSLAYAVLLHGLARTHGLRWAVWENVPGVLSTPDNAFGCLLAALVGGDDPVEPVARPCAGRSNAFWRWRPAGVEADDDGVERPVAAGHITRWPGVGMAAGPLGRAAWRILDAQHFGVPQRRRRVFVVVGIGEWADPAAVLFESASLRRHSPPRGEAREDVAGSLTSSLGRRCGQPSGGDIAGQLIAHTLRADGFDTSEDGTGRGIPLVPVAFGGNDTRGPVEVATALNAHSGPHGRQDFESETFVVALALQARDGAKDVDSDCTDTLIACDLAETLSVGANQTFGFIGKVVAFQGCGSNLDLGQDITGTLTGNGDRASGGAPCVAFDAYNQTASTVSHPLRVGSGRCGDEVPQILDQWSVRRLTPTECHRLQGFPDDWCAIPGAADGPIYKALGNSMAVPVMRWIGERIAAVDASQDFAGAAE